MMATLLKKYDIKNYFFFDMSVCDTVIYVEKKLQIASRLSEYEEIMPFYQESKVVWIDYFNSDGSTIQKVKDCLKDGKTPCVVSPELHKRPFEQMWLGLQPYVNDDNIYLCTDYPNKAKVYFKI